MGYTNYMTRQREFTDEEWLLVSAGCALIMVKWYRTFARFAFGPTLASEEHCHESYHLVHRILQSNTEPAEQASLLLDYFKKSKTVLCAFDDELCSEWLRLEQKRTEFQDDSDDLFDFVKTNRNAISDPLVVAVYSCLAYLFPDICVFTSDGMACSEDEQDDINLKQGKLFFEKECKPCLEPIKLMWQVVLKGFDKAKHAKPAKSETGKAKSQACEAKIEDFSKIEDF